MKKIKTILLSVMAILMIMSVSVFAAELGLEIAGENEAKAKETKTLTVKIVSENDMGVFSGKVIGDGNISNIQVSGKNNWNLLAYENNSFKLVKTQGGKNEDALEITYTIKEGATGKAKITLSNIDLTDLDYKTTSVANVEKEITIQENAPIVALTGIEITKAPTKVKYQVDEKFSKDGMEVKASYSDGTSKVIENYTYLPDGKLKESDKEIVVSYSENEITKTAKQAITVEKKVPANNTPTNNTPTNNVPTNNTPANKVNNATNPPIVIGGQTQKDNTVADKELSKAGIDDFVFFAMVAICVVGTVLYIKINKMKEIK